ncbi:hypothetical protein SteCoe_9467 [Stentor coeruleus]|uniref:Uncharacterized protein n=1 Tax=Stentor coeruleus TaxID=5963 RepID=A0A1R2CHV0_9CILI|nr:hypothetical protein SteCoe_9467 [Stentor coeruleus]
MSYCFSMFKKLMGDKFFSQDPILPINKVPEIGSSELKTIQKKEIKPTEKKVEKKHEEDDDLFKEMQPNYVAPKRIGSAILASNNEKSSSRFDMEIDVSNSWNVEELN